MSEFLSRLGGAAMNDLRGTPLDSILNRLMGGQQNSSGLEALVDRLRQGGLGPQVDSWIAGDRSREVRPDELERALGAENVDRMCADCGGPTHKEGLMGVLASLLPGLVDRLTPGGQMPRTDAEMPQGGLGGILGGLLGQLRGAPGNAAAGGGLTDLLGQLLGSRHQPPR